MGIKRFSGWFKKHIAKHTQYFNPENNPKLGIDELLLDLNGIIHTAAQKIFKYGQFADPKKTHSKKKSLGKVVPENEVCYREACNIIEEFVNLSNPHRLVLAIDGVAPIAKQQQQRQRRYKTVLEEDLSKLPFNPVVISPGTEFLRGFSAYLEKFIIDKVKKDKWDVVFSDDEGPGEGEHKLMSYVRKYGDDKKIYCMNGQDADLFMLTMTVPNVHMVLLREEPFNKNFKYSYTDMTKCKEQIKLYLKRDDETRAVYDFILICFFSGNDFLPNIPNVSIDDGGIDHIISMYRGRDFYLCDEKAKISYSNLKILFGYINEQRLYNYKHIYKNNYIKDPLLDNPNFVEFRKQYNKECIIDVKKQSIDYLETLQWIMNYYINGLKDWDWSYNYIYVPTIYDLNRYISTVQYIDKETSPTHPMHQLLCILPPSCHYLLPKKFQTFATEHPEFYLKDIKIHYEGKKQEWEGIVDMEPIDWRAIQKIVKLEPYNFKIPIHYVIRNYKEKPHKRVVRMKMIF